MATETELKLSLSPQDARKLKDHPRLAALAPRRRLLRNTYYDTPRCDLTKLGVAVRFRQIGRQWLLTVKSGEPAGGGLARRNEWENPAVPGHFDFSFVEADELRQRLEALVPDLEPIFTTHFHRTIWHVQVEDSRIEVAFDRGHVQTGERRLPICEVEMELIDGDIAGIFALARALQTDLPLRPMVVSKAERGYALHAGEAPKPFRAQRISIIPTMTPEAAFRIIAFGCLEQLQRNEVRGPGQTDIEFVHQARVALRRLRSALKLFKPVLSESILAFGTAWKAMATTLGEARNWDIFVGETLPALTMSLPTSPELLRLKRGSQREAARARREVQGLFASAEYACLLLAFTEAVALLPETSDTPLDTFAHKRLGRLQRRAKRITRECDDASWHPLRIRLKELRYALEFFSPLWPHKHFKPYLAALNKIQNALGLANDHQTALLLLDRLGTPAGRADAWLRGRAALLTVQLPDAVHPWRATRPPWKRT
ncbi:MAG: CHAD domain-containing protein [Betaproteobacteria bacterium]